MSATHDAESEEPAAIAELSDDACWSLLEAGSLGRLGMIDADGDPEILPVNYLTHERRIYLRSAHGGKLRTLRRHPVVAFEIDGADGEERWSVLVRGRAEEVAVDDELRRSGAAGLRTDAPVAKPFVVRIDPAVVTGRRFRVGPPPAAASAPGTLPRPRPISHRPPLTE